MTRFLVSGCFFLAAFVFETSFLVSLPLFFSLSPFVFACGVYLIQHHGLLDGFFWILFYGLFIQLFHLHVSPFPLIGYATAAAVCLFTARQVFSNRSLYGVIACGWVGYFLLVLIDAIGRFFQLVGTHVQGQWSDYFLTQGKIFLVLAFTLFVLFTFARPLRILIHSRTF